MNLYQITQQHLKLIEILEDMEGDLTENPDVEKELLNILNSGDEKITAYYHVFANFRGQLEAINSELERITKLKKTVENNMKNIKTVLEQFMKITGRDRFEDGIVKMILAKKQNFSYSIFPSDFIETVTTEREKLADFKAWCKLNPEDAENHYGAKFIPDTYIQIK